MIAILQKYLVKPDTTLKYLQISDKLEPLSSENLESLINTSMI